MVMENNVNCALDNIRDKGSKTIMNVGLEYWNYKSIHICKHRLKRNT